MEVLRISMLFGLAFFNVVSSQNTVHTTTGVLHGKRTTTLKMPLTQFLGVPYAKPPVGELRFLPPLEMVTDTITRDSTIYAPSCYQPEHLRSAISPLLKVNESRIDEDCLYLNVFVPQTHESSPLPVMVWLPGEGFDYADARQFDGSYLAVLGKVIVVTVNYRVSVFGFLSTLTPDAPGNVGLLDQRMALRWIKKNIAKFGGDSENVTLFGRFSGSMSVGIHTFSPLNQQEQLFRRAIMQSGVPVGEWVYDKNPMNATQRLAENTNCLFSLVQDTLSCLRRLPSKVLLERSLEMSYSWRPVYDYHLIFEDVLKAAARRTSGKIDVLLGINTDEGSLCTIALSAMHSPLYQKILSEQLTLSDFQELVDSNMMSVFKSRDLLLNKLAVHEYANADDQSRFRDFFIGFCGDLYVTSHVQRLADVLASKDEHKTYMYEFAHRPSFSIQPEFIRAGHGDDVLFALGLPFELPHLPEEEAKLTKRVVDSIANFARRGNPNRPGTNEAWPEYTVQDRRIMTFTTPRKDDGEEVVRKSSHDYAVTFWHDVIPIAAHRSCPMSTLLPGPSQERDPREQGAFLGGLLTAPAAECALLALLCFSAFLFFTSTISVILLIKSKRQTNFQRLR